MNGPLEGIRVFDWTIAGVGPFSGMLLGALGADVIKIETPEGGDLIKQVPPSQKGMGVIYILCNLNKKGIFLDLKKERDKEIAYKLLETCDVFVNNMRADVPRRLGLDYETVSSINPRIIYVVSTAWGSKGPMAALAGADAAVQAFCGWCSINGKTDGKWEMYRHQGHQDFNTSNYIVGAVLQGLIARERTGKGQRVELSMLGSAISLQTSRLAEYLVAGVKPEPLGSAAATTAPNQAFRCLDKGYVAVGVENDRQWLGLCKAIGREDLAKDHRFSNNARRVENQGALMPELEKCFMTKPVPWWVKRLSEEGVPNGRFMNMDTLLYYPQVLDNEHLVTLDTGRWGKVYAPGPPWKFSKTPGNMKPNPAPGQHTQEVVASLK